MSIERQLRGKRSTFTINLIQTPHGFSLIEGTELLNKIEGQPNIVQQLQPSTSTHPPAYSAPSKEYKPVFKKTNLLFVRNKQADTTTMTALANEVLATPSYCRVFAPWFDLNSLHQAERKEVSEWFCEKFKVSSQEAEEKEELEQWLKLYQKHRNFIVQLYIKQFAQDRKYLSANCIRKYLSHDAYWVMKIHLFLSSLGVINTHNPNFAFQSKTYTHILKGRKDGKKELLAHQLTTAIGKEGQEKDQSLLLKKITANIRPYCDYCRIHCGIVWFQHTRSLDPKEIANIMKNVNSKNPPLSQKEYEYVLCVKCYCEGHFPLLLTHHDFKKLSINDRLEPGRKKKSKRRRKDKRPKEGEQNQEEKQAQEQRSHEEEDEAGKKEQTNALIAKLINAVEQHAWTLEETNLLLQLVERHGEDWAAVHEHLKKKGHARNLQTEQVILYFLSLPRRGIGKLKQEYNNEQFIQCNLSANKLNVSDRLAELKLNQAMQFTNRCRPDFLKEMSALAGRRDYPWKTQLQQLICLQKRKIEARLNYLVETQSLVKLLKVDTRLA